MTDPKWNHRQSLRYALRMKFEVERLHRALEPLSAEGLVEVAEYVHLVREDREWDFLKFMDEVQDHAGWQASQGLLEKRKSWARMRDWWDMRKAAREAEERYRRAVEENAE